jgi:hypothetical protein
LPTAKIAAELGQLQLAYSNIGPVSKALQRSDIPPGWNEIADWSAASKSLWWQWCRLQVCDGAVYRRFESADAKHANLQIVLPRSEWKKFLHFTLELKEVTSVDAAPRLAVQARAYWPSWGRDVRLTEACCEQCARYRHGKPPRQTPLKPFQAGDVWETVAIDVIGPLPVSREAFDTSLLYNAILVNGRKPFLSGGILQKA